VPRRPVHGASPGRDAPAIDRGRGPPDRLEVHRADRKAQVSQPTRCAVPALDQGMGTRVVQAPWLATAPQSGAAQQAAWLRPLLGTGGAFHDRPGSGRSSARSKSRSGRKLPAGERLCPPTFGSREQPVHGFGAGGEHQSELATVDDLRCAAGAAAGQAGDLLDGDARARPAPDRRPTGSALLGAIGQRHIVR